MENEHAMKENLRLRGIKHGFHLTFTASEMQNMKMILQVFRAMKIFIPTFCVTLPCYFDGGCWYVGVMCFLSISSTLKTEALGSSEMLVPTIYYHNPECHNPIYEDVHNHCHCNHNITLFRFKNLGSADMTWHPHAKVSCTYGRNYILLIKLTKKVWYKLWKTLTAHMYYIWPSQP